MSEATTHYVGQAVKQLYVLVLGLDVLGNPYGLVLGLTKGVEDLFYEPFQVKYKHACVQVLCVIYLYRCYRVLSKDQVNSLKV